MATNQVHRARRLTVTFAVAHAAGDLVYVGGFYGVVQDKVAAGDTGVLILEGAWTLPRVPSTVAMGIKLAAPATEIATSLPLLSYAGPTGIGGGGVTAGWNQIGRTIATGNATVADVQLFNPNDF